MDVSLTKLIGSVVLALFLVSIPILVGLSYVFDWYFGIQVILTFATLAEFLVLKDKIYESGL